MKISAMFPMLMFGVASSYLTLVVAATDRAADWYAGYALVMFVLTLGNLWATR